jgi:hypothetical protein
MSRMTWFTVRLFGAVAVLAFAAPAGASSISSRAASGFASVTGSGWRGNVSTPTTPTHHFVVSAHSGPQGVAGFYTLSGPVNGLLDFTGRVTCLDVVGDHAVVGGVVTDGGAPGQIGTGFAVGFIDTGPASDTQTFTDVELAAPVDCAAEQSLFTLTLFPVLNGNIVVNGTLQPTPTCTPGSENFSEDSEFSQPTTFSGGTIDSSYGTNAGGVRVQPTSWAGGFADQTHVLYTGGGVEMFQLTFNNRVHSVQLEAEANSTITEQLTLTGYSATNSVLATTTVSNAAFTTDTLAISASSDIKYFTLGTTTNLGPNGLGFSNIVWGCST